MFDRMMFMIDEFISSVNSLARQNIGAYCRLQTSDDDFTIVSDDGSLVSLFHIDGTYEIVDAEKFSQISDNFVTSWTPVMSHPGHVIQVIFSYDPARGRDEIYQQINPSRITAKNIGLDIDDILVDSAEALAKFVASEHCFIALWTRPDCLPTSAKAAAKTEMNKSIATGPISGPQTQDVCRTIGRLKGSHEKAVQAFQSLFAACGIKFRRLTAHEHIKSARMEADRSATGSKWRALLPGDRLPAGYPEPGERDLSCLLYPAIHRQIFPREGINISRKAIRIGDMLHCPLAIELMPQQPQPFSSLFNTLIQRNMPWRISYLLEPDGIGGLAIQSLLCGILAFTSSTNKMFNTSLKQLKKEYLSGQTIIKFSIICDTWIFAHEEQAEKRLYENANAMAGLLQNWGACETAELIGDPLLGTAATIPGIMPASPARKSAAPLADAVAMLPITRGTSPWEFGSTLFRTPDGKAYPYQQGSSKQRAWVDIGVAPMGSGKSVLLNEINFGHLLQPGSTELPWLTIIDVGPSSKGLIKMIQAALPSDKRYLATYQPIQMSEKYAMNPFDTELGFRTPHPFHREFLVNLLTLLATPPGESAPPDGITGLAELCLKMAYEQFSDKHDPKLYDPQQNNTINNIVNTLSLHISEKTTWWQITDMLYDAGYIHEAHISQRYAVPLLADIAAMAQDDRAKRVYHSQISSESITQYFWRHLIEALKSFPLLKVPTNFDIGDARVISLDLGAVTPRGSAAADHKSVIMFMLARHAGASKFFFGEDDIEFAPERYRAYHQKRVSSIRSIPKRITYDEGHRMMKYASMVKQVEVDIREGRKWSISTGIYSQDLDDLPEILQKLTSTLFILGANNTTSVEQVTKIFSLNKQCKDAIERIGKPNYKGSKLVAKFITDNNSQQVLILTLGKQKIWAYSTTAEDAELRDYIVEKIGQRKALKLLAARYPEGTVKHIIEQRSQYIQNDETSNNNSILYSIKQELLEESQTIKEEL